MMTEDLDEDTKYIGTINGRKNYRRTSRDILPTATDQQPIRVPRPTPPPPPEPLTLQVMADNFGVATVEWAKSGFAVVSRDEFDSRMEICNDCEHWDGKARFGMGKCGVCGCTSMKQWLLSSSCPLDPPKWKGKSLNTMKLIGEVIIENIEEIRDAISYDDKALTLLNAFNDAVTGASCASCTSKAKAKRMLSEMEYDAKGAYTKLQDIVAKRRTDTTDS